MKYTELGIVSWKELQLRVFGMDKQTDGRTGGRVRSIMRRSRGPHNITYGYDHSCGLVSYTTSWALHVYSVCGGMYAFCTPHVVRVWWWLRRTVIAESVITSSAAAPILLYWTNWARHPHCYLSLCFSFFFSSLTTAVVTLRQGRFSSTVSAFRPKIVIWVLALAPRPRPLVTSLEVANTETMLTFFWFDCYTYI